MLELCACAERTAASGAVVAHVGSVRGAQRGGSLRDALGPLVPDAGGGVHRGAGAAGHPGQGRALQPAESPHRVVRAGPGAAAGTGRAGGAARGTEVPSAALSIPPLFKYLDFHKVNVKFIRNNSVELRGLSAAPGKVKMTNSRGFSFFCGDLDSVSVHPLLKPKKPGSRAGLLSHR